MVKRKNKKQKPISIDIEIPEYDEVYNQFCFHVLRKRMEAKDPVLNMIPTSSTERRGGNIVGGNNSIQLEPIHMETSFQITTEAVKNTNIDDFLLSMEKSSDDALESYMPQFFSRLSETLSENTIDAQGQPFSPDHIIAAIDKMQLSFDENEDPILPELIMPLEVKPLLNTTIWTEAQNEKLQQILERKKEEYVAKKRIRKLR